MAAAGKIEAVIFDVGGVLDRPADLEGEKANRVQLAAGLGLELDEMWRLFYQTEPWKLARVGDITDSELWDRNLTPFGITEPADQQAFVRRLFTFKEVVPEMRALLEELHGRVKLGIISNASDILEVGLDQYFRIAPFFDVIVNSAGVGCAKPDPQIFHIALKRLDVRPEQTIFTDDQQHNVEAAAELGIHAVLFTGVAELRKFLVEREVLETE